MKIQKSFQLALDMLIHSKLRSWLTIIGIIIGIGSIVAIMSISEGAQQEMESRLNSLGADIVTVTPGFSMARGPGGFEGGSPNMFGEESSDSDQKNLTSRDVNVLRSISNVKYVMGSVSAQAEISYLGKSGDVSITGVDTSVWKDIIYNDLDSGRYLTISDTNAAVIGYGIAHDFFDDDVQLNQQITIEGKLFKVVGIFEEGGNDRAVIIPIETARGILEDVGDKEFDSISIKIDDTDLFDETLEDIEGKLMLSRGILREEEKDFSISSTKAMQETMQETMNTISLFLGSIAAISLLVGAIGIANTMFTSVLEKTREIGIMKAIGTKNRDIMMIFLLKSGLIGLIGGIGGIIGGSIASTFISSYAGISSGGGMGRGMFGSTFVSPELLIFSLLFSLLIGIISGVVPAYMASKLNPVDALRHE